LREWNTWHAGREVVGISSANPGKTSVHGVTSHPSPKHTSAPWLEKQRG